MTLNRRDLIAALLGAPALALLGCDARAKRLPPTGDLLGQSVEIGHRLRDGLTLEVPADRWVDVEVAIVGGGMSGLSAAWQLQRSGVEDFVVLELETVAGGTSRSGACELTPFPWGAHYVPVPLAHNTALIELLREMHVVESVSPDGSPIVAEQFLCREPEERLFFHGEWIEGLYSTTGATADDLAQLAAFRNEVDRWIAWRDEAGRRAFVIPTHWASDADEVMALDQLSMSEWLRQRGFTSERLHWLVDYSCRDDYGLRSDQTSAWAGLLYFAGRLREPGAEHQPLITWPEGNGRIVEHLAQRIGLRLRTGAAVSRIRPPVNSNDEPIEVIWLNTQTGQAHGYRARHVIFAAPQFMAPRLINGFAKRTGRSVSEFEYGSWLTANLHLSHRLRESGFPLSWDNVIHGSRSLGYVVATHQSGRDHGPAVLTWYLPYCDADVKFIREQLLAATWSDLAEVVLTDLEQAHPDIREITTRLDIFRWGHAMIRPKLGFHSSPQRREAARADGRIHFANTDLSGLALFEEAFSHGCRAAEEVVQRSSHRPS